MIFSQLFTNTLTVRSTDKQTDLSGWQGEKQIITFIAGHLQNF